MRPLFQLIAILFAYLGFLIAKPEKYPIGDFGPPEVRQEPNGFGKVVRSVRAYVRPLLHLKYEGHGCRTACYSLKTFEYEFCLYSFVIGDQCDLPFSAEMYRAAAEYLPTTREGLKGGSVPLIDTNETVIYIKWIKKGYGYTLEDVENFPSVIADNWKDNRAYRKWFRRELFEM